MEIHNHSDELEQGINKEVNQLFPHRRVIIQIGKDFRRKDIAEKLLPYGEVRMGCYKSGSFYEQQVELDGILYNEGTTESTDKDELRQNFNKSSDMSMRITITEEDKVAGMIALHFQSDSFDELLTDEMKSVFHQRLRSPPQVTSTRFIVHPNFRRQHLGVHLHLMRFFCCWFFSTEFTGESFSPVNKGILQRTGAEVIGKFDLTEEFTSRGIIRDNYVLYLFYSEYSKRQLYYQNILDMMKKSLKHNKSRL